MAKKALVSREHDVPEYGQIVVEEQVEVRFELGPKLSGWHVDYEERAAPSVSASRRVHQLRL